MIGLLLLGLAGCDAIGPAVPVAVSGARLGGAVAMLVFTLPVALVAAVTVWRGGRTRFLWALGGPIVGMAVLVDGFLLVRTSVLPKGDLPVILASTGAFWAVAWLIAAGVAAPERRAVALVGGLVAPLPFVGLISAIAFAELAPLGQLASVRFDEISCGRYDDGHVACWFLDETTLLPGRFRDVDTEGPVLCVATDTGDVRCGFAGQPLESQVLARGAVQVVVSEDEVCARLEDGTVACNTPDPQVWTARLTTHLAMVPGLHASRLVAGRQGVCALETSGDISCWNLGLGTPHRVDGLSPSTDVGMGWGQVCGIVAGAVSCANDANELPLTGGAPIAGLEGAKALGMGEAYVCALLTSGDVACSGDDGLGERGILGVDPYDRPVTQVPLPGPATSIDGGPAVACAALGDGRLWCWGSDRDGVLPGTWPIDCGEDPLHLTYDPCVVPPQPIDPG